MSPPRSPVTSSPHSSTAGLSPPRSGQLPTLQQLVDHFVAAKRALTSTAQVVRANEIVTEARAALEENAILSAKNGFARTCVTDQVRSLEAVRLGIGKVGEEGEEEFQAVLRTLDAADARLKHTLNVLRSTLSHHSLNPSKPAQPLYTFVDERAVADVTAALHSSIDSYKAAAENLADTLSSFDDVLSTLHSSFAVVSSPPDKDITLAIPAHLRDLEGHATEMADLLQGLVRHYDLCISALKHTEGGGEAAAQATGGELDVGAEAGIGVPVASLATDGAAAPLSEEERAEMMAVLDKDAAEVDDVVAEIKERGAEMETLLQSVTAHRAQVREEHDGLLAVVRQLVSIGKQLPAYVGAGNEFLEKWDNEKTKISESLEEMQGLKDFYEGFLGAYDGLIVEIGRRKNVQLRTQKILQDAMAKIEKLYQEDIAERDAFKADQGEYLPSDIWPGLMEPPVKYEIQPLDSSIVEIPDIPRDVLEMAVQRLRGRLQAR